MLYYGICYLIIYFIYDNSNIIDTAINAFGMFIFGIVIVYPIMMLIFLYRYLRSKYGK